MAPEAWGGFGLVISLSKTVGSEEIVGKNAGLGKAITALANLEVDLPITITTLKVVFLNEFCRNVSNFNADIFEVWNWSIEVEVFEVNGAETCAWARKHTIEVKLDKFKGCNVGSHIAWEADAIAAYHHGVADFLLFMLRDVVVVNKEEGFSAHNLFCVERWPHAYALA